MFSYLPRPTVFERFIHDNFSIFVGKNGRIQVEDRLRKLKQFQTISLTLVVNFEQTGKQKHSLNESAAF